jgi:hypothetical protein
MELRRESPRIDVETLCWELIDGRETSGLAVDLSANGLCLERPYAGGPTRREVPLQLEIPGIDEVMWARGDACFDVVVASRGVNGGPLGLVRRTGYRIVAAQRDLRRLREVVTETDRARLASGASHSSSRRAPPGGEFGLASFYLRARA